jgi:hypothetical protein
MELAKSFGSVVQNGAQEAKLDYFVSVLERLQHGAQILISLDFENSRRQCVKLQQLISAGVKSLSDLFYNLYEKGLQFDAERLSSGGCSC